MSPIAVSIHPVSLLNVSDHITRNLENDIGILLGGSLESIVTVNTSFEVVTQGSLINVEYLTNRTDQFKTILPQRSVVGMYFLSRGSEVKDDMLPVINQVYQFKNSFATQGPIIISVFNRDVIHNTPKNAVFQSYIYDGSNIQPVKLIITPSESEAIAATTIENNKIYFDSTQKTDGFDDEVTAQSHAQDLNLSVSKLKDKIGKIIRYLERSKELEDIDERIQTNNLITHLSIKLKTLKENRDTIADVDNLNYGLSATELSLLSKQLILIDNVKTTIYKKLLQSSLSGPANYMIEDD